MPSCRGVVFNGDGTYEIRAFELPRPGPGGAVLKVEAVGMCGSDVAQLRGFKHVPGEVAPVVPGHEIVGRVHALGEGAAFGVEVGDRVAVDLVVRAPRSAENPSGIRALYGYTLGTEHEHGLWGGYGEYMGVLPGTQLLRLTQEVPAEALTIFEPLASAVHWIEQIGIEKGDSVVVQGPGHMGLICAAMARLAGAGTVIVTGTAADAKRLEAAREIGADHTIDVEAEDVVARVRELTGRRMANVVMDLAAEATITVKLALEMAAFQGRILLGGLKNERPVELVSDQIIFKSLTIVGGAGSTPASMREAVRLLNSGAFPTAPLIGEVFTLDALDRAMALLERKDPAHDAVRVGLVHR